MSDQRGWLTRFVEDFGKLPEDEPKPLIPKPYRVPVFVGMMIVSLVLLAVLLWLVVVPAIRSQQTSRSHSVSSARSCDGRSRTNGREAS